MVPGYDIPTQQYPDSQCVQGLSSSRHIGTLWPGVDTQLPPNGQWISRGKHGYSVIKNFNFPVILMYPRNIVTKKMIKAATMMNINTLKPFRRPLII